MKHAIRLGRPSDLPFVTDTWVKKGREKGERISSATARVRAILAHHDTCLRVATLTDDDDAILGWAVIGFDKSPHTLHYVYVRSTARHQGIARSLLVGVDTTALKKPKESNG